MDLSAYYSNQQPAVMSGAAFTPALAGGRQAADAPIILAQMQFMLHEQEQRYGNGEQPPVQVQQLPYDGPPLRYLMTGRQVKFCNTREEVLYNYRTVPEGRYWPVAEYAARLQGPRGGGVVRARITTTGALSCCD
jgi:hypothetical protein